MRLVPLLILLLSCSAVQDNSNCEFECVDCKKVSFKCTDDNDIEIINNKAVL